MRHALLLAAVLAFAATATAAAVYVQAPDGIGFHSDSAAVPAVVGRSTRYYAGLFYNVEDQGSDLANAQAIGLVGQSVYGNAFYAQQGGAPGSPGDVLYRDNVYSAAYITRVTGNMNGYDYKAPLLRLNDSSTGSGALMDAEAQTGKRVFLMDRVGRIAISPGGVSAPAYALDVVGQSSVAARFTGATSPSANTTQVRWAGRKDGELWATGTDISTATGRRDYEFYNLVTGAAALTITSDDLVRLAPRTLASLGAPPDGTIAYCADCGPGCGPGPGRFAWRQAGQWACP